jgi:glycosyltransferase involved in cell wall biosynthesis
MSASTQAVHATMARPLLLAVATVPPWPAKNGHALRIGQLLRQLGRCWDVLLVAPAPATGWDSSAWGVASLVPLRMSGAWTCLPSQYDWLPLQAEVDRLVTERRPAAALLWSGTEFLAMRAGFPPAVADRIDCMTLISWRSIHEERRWRTRVRALRDMLEYGRYERRLVRRLTATVVVGEDDARALRRLGGRDTVHVVPNGVTLPTVPVKREDPTPTVIFSGVMAYPPNIDAVRWFANSVWPLVRARKPLARFVIAGRGPTPEVTALAELPGVEVLGAVPDMTAVLGRAWLAVAPMRSGAGIKNKVLEAWAAGTPVVMTQMAGNGLSLDRDAQQLVTDQPKEFAARIVALLDDPAERWRHGASARSLAADRHSWAAAGAQLSALLAAAAGLAPPRAA